MHTLFLVMKCWSLMSTSRIWRKKTRIAENKKWHKNKMNILMKKAYLFVSCFPSRLRLLTVRHKFLPLAETNNYWFLPGKKVQMSFCVQRETKWWGVNDIDERRWAFFFFRKKCIHMLTENYKTVQIRIILICLPSFTLLRCICIEV